jgi:phosphatidylserine decarboxylase
MFTSRTLREGSGPILCLALLAVAGALISPWLALVPLLVLGFTIMFFRDPRRLAPPDPAAILAPADGTVVAIERVREDEYIGAEAIRIAIFLSVFDVHVQRSPVRGEIGLVRYRSGRHLDARTANAGLHNENRLIGIRCPDGARVAVRQIGGKVARRIVGWKGMGAALERGERLGMIRFGSRVEIFLPEDVEIAVAAGAHVKGGETVLARRS